MYLDQIEKLADVLFFLIEQLSEDDLDLLKNKNFLSKVSSKLRESSESPDDDEYQENSENIPDVDNMKVDEDVEDDHDELVESKDGEMSESDFTEDSKDPEFKPRRSETPVKIKNKKESIPSLNKCMICDEDVDDPENHDADHHMEAGNFKCNEGCDFVCEEKKSLVEHSAVFHKDIDVFKCPDCEDMFFRMKSLADHLIKQHGIDIPARTCPICMNTFPNYSKYKAHLEWEHRRPRKCDQCDKIYKCKPALRTHIKVCHEKPDITCHICGKTTKSKELFEVHMKKHKNEEKTIQCTQCDKRFHTTFEMKAHLLNVHRKDRYLCSQCDYSSASSHTLKRHIGTVHSDERNFICGTCGAAFKDKLTLAGHELCKHTNQRNFECEICGKKFKTQSHRRTHQRIHTGDYEASCERCGKQFVQKYNYKLHILKCHGASS